MLTMTAVSSLRLPILNLAVREQRYSCHGCGNCCRDFTVQLRADDLAKLRVQDWETKLGRPVTIDFRGTTYLRQREDGSCVFLMDDGLCRIHKEFGFAAKPIACQLFPFHLTPNAAGISMGLNFACQSVLENKGAELASHQAELKRMAGAIEELAQPQSPPLLAHRLRAEPREVESAARHIDRWLQRTDLGLPLRLDGLAWVVQSLAKAKLENVRGERFDELLQVLFSALPEELDHHPIRPPTARQMKLLRQAVFARTEDPKLNSVERRGSLRTRLSQLSRSRRFKSGRGIAPLIGVDWPASVPLQDVRSITASTDPMEIEAIDELLTRWLRATVLGGRAWGAGYYGWSIVNGLQAMLLNAACVGWLARLHAAGRNTGGTPAPLPLGLVDVRAALGRIDRASGRAKWLGSAAEHLRLGYLGLDDGIRRIIAHTGT